MADLFKSVFAESLVKEPLIDCKLETDCYPSPDKLKHRIILKHKKLEAGTNEVILNSTKPEDDLCNSLHNGFLYLEDKIDGQWTKVRMKKRWRNSKQFVSFSSSSNLAKPLYFERSAPHVD
jgi:hypothetical protein